MTAIHGFGSASSFAAATNRNTGFGMARAKNDSASGSLHVAQNDRAEKPAGEQQTRPVSMREVRDGVMKAEAKAVQSLVKGIDTLMGDSPETVLAGRTREQFESFRKDIDDAVSNQNYGKARELIDGFYSGSSKHLQSELEKIMHDSDMAFTAGVREVFKNMVFADELTNPGDKAEDKLAGVVELALDAAYEQNPGPSGMENWEDGLAELRSNAASYGKSKLRNAGRNHYTEDGDSMLRSAGEHGRKLLSGSQSTVDELNAKAEQGSSDIYFGASVGGLAERYTSLQEDFLEKFDDLRNGRKMVQKVEDAQAFAEAHPELMTAGHPVPEIDLSISPDLAAKLAESIIQQPEQGSVDQYMNVDEDTRVGVTLDTTT